MPHSSGKTYTFYDEDGESYPFYAESAQQAINNAAVWARKQGKKLYRIKHGSRPKA